MATGTVIWLRWFNESKGFGFIRPDGGGDDLFAHCSAVNTPGFQTLHDGQKVSFDIAADSKRKQASNIRGRP